MTIDRKSRKKTKTTGLPLLEHESIGRTKDQQEEKNRAREEVRPPLAVN